MRGKAIASDVFDRSLGCRESVAIQESFRHGATIVFGRGSESERAKDCEEERKNEQGRRKEHGDESTAFKPALSLIAGRYRHESTRDHEASQQ